MASLTDLATKCRFAVLEVSDDEDEEKPGVGDKARSSKGADANKATAAKKKRKKKKNRAKNTQVLNNSERAARNEEETEEIEQSLDHDEWDEWLQKDEQYVLSQFQRDLKTALEASKQEQQQKRQQQQELLHDVSTPEISQENTKEKRKKEKPVVMSLDEFRMTAPTNEISDSTKTEKQQFGTDLDEFFEKQDDFTLQSQESHENVNSQGVPASSEVVQMEEKPSTAGKAVKLSGRKKNNSRSESDAKTPEKVTQTVPEKKLLPATHEDQIQAEMVHIKDELDKTGHELIELRKTKAEHIKIIEDLKKELSQVKKRNKQLCFILSQAEMKEKSELLMQIEELNEVKEQFVQLHAELEQERSKNSALKSELAKSSGGRQRHGSSS